MFSTISGTHYCIKPLKFKRKKILEKDIISISLSPYLNKNIH